MLRISTFRFALFLGLTSILPACYVFAQCPSSVGSAPFSTPVTTLYNGAREPSGVLWHPIIEKIMMVDDGGRLMVLNADGSGLTEYTLTASGYSDFEGITIANPLDPDVTFYVVVENPPAILEFEFTALNSAANNAASRVFTVDIPDVNAAAVNQRLEGIEFIPWSAFAGAMPTWLNGQSEPSLHGIFYIAQQSNGCAYALGIQAPGDGNSITYYNNKEAVFCSGNGDLAALHFDACRGVLYGSNDGNDRLRQFSPQGALLNNWPLAGIEQEGVALYPGLQLLLAQDVGQLCLFGFNPFNETLPVRCNSCGNAQVEAPEECDDGNYISGDGCENNCTLTVSATATPTASSTPTRTAIATATASATATITRTPTATTTRTFTSTATATASNAATPVPSATATSTPQEILTPTQAPGESPSPTPQLEVSATATANAPATGVATEAPVPPVMPPPKEVSQFCENLVNSTPPKPRLRYQNGKLFVTLPRFKSDHDVSYAVRRMHAGSEEMRSVDKHNFRFSRLKAGRHKVRYNLICDGESSALSPAARINIRR